MTLFFHHHLETTRIKSYPMDYVYLLAVMWCADWQMHGLWVDYPNGTYPQNCTNTPFDLNAIKADTALYTNMTTYWHGCYGDEDDFWQHEWTKHGTCTGLSILDYFTEAVGYFLQYLPSLDDRCQRDGSTCTIPLNN